MKYLESSIDRLFAEKTVSNLAVKIGRGDQVIREVYRSAEMDLDGQTLFDMASVTKILGPTTLALMAMDRGALSADDPVSLFFPVPEDKKSLTVGHLLTHTMGIGHKDLTGFSGGEIGEYILNIPSDISIGSDVRYSCPGFILLGRILEDIFGMPLWGAFSAFVAAPLGMDSTGFLPDKSRRIVNANLQEDLRGVVNDYNCRHLGGVAGNAGIFSNMDDLTRYVKMLQDEGDPLFSSELFALARKNHTSGRTESRGLGYLYVDDRYAQTGGLFSQGSIGHCGHTGQSLFLDPDSGFYVIILSDATVSTEKKYGKEAYGEVMQMRHDLHRAIREDFESL